MVSFFPATAPFAMPNRIAMSSLAWWELAVAAVITLAAIAALVHLGGRVCTAAIVHTGPALKLREAWRGTTTPPPSATEPDTGHPTTSPPQPGPMVGDRQMTTTTEQATDRWASAAVIGIAAGLAAAVGVLVADVVIGVAVGAFVFAVATKIVNARAGRQHPHYHQ